MLNFIFQIVLNQDCETCVSDSHGLLWDLGKDYTLPIVLAGLAAYMVYFIFIKETNRDKENELRKKNDERKDKLYYLAALIENVLHSSIEQKDNIKTHIRDIRANDVDFHLMTYLPLNDFKRVSETLNLEVYLLAYTNEFYHGRKESVKDFKNIIAAVDYLYEIFQQIPEQLKKSQMYDYERKQRLSNIYAEAHNLVGRLLLMFERYDKSRLQELGAIMDNFSNNHPEDNYDIKFYHEFFFVPINDFCVKHTRAEDRIIQEILDLAILSRDGKQMFVNIKSENQLLKKSLASDFKNIYRSILSLKVKSKKLLTLFNND